MELRYRSAGHNGRRSGTLNLRTLPPPQTIISSDAHTSDDPGPFGGAPTIDIWVQSSMSGS